MANINTNSSMSARLNGKTISLGMFNGRTVFGGSADITLSGNVTDNVTNGSVTSSYSVSGASGATGTFQITITPDSGYHFTASTSVTVSGLGTNITGPSSWSLSGVNLVGTFSYTIPSSNTTDNFSVSASATQTSVTGNISYSLASNVTISNQTESYSALPGATVSWTATLTAATNFEFSGGVTQQVVTGSFLAPIGGGDQTIDLTSYTVTTTLSTLTISITDNAGGDVSSNKVSITATKGSTQTFSVIGQTIGTDTYYSSNIVMSSPTYSTLTSGPVYSAPQLSGVSNQFYTTQTFNYSVVMPNENRTESLTATGGNVSTLKSVQWTGDTQSVPSNANNSATTLTFYSTDPDGEPPTISDNASWVNIGTLTYSGGTGSAEMSIQANNSTDSRDATITITSSIDSATDTYTLTQDGAPQVIATSATFLDDTSKFDRFEIDTSGGAGSMAFSFTTVPVGGLVSFTTVGLPSGVSVSLNNANNTITINYPANEDANFSVWLHPQGNLNTDLDTLYLSLSSGI